MYKSQKVCLVSSNSSGTQKPINAGSFTLHPVPCPFAEMHMVRYIVTINNLLVPLLLCPLGTGVHCYNGVPEAFQEERIVFTSYQQYTLRSARVRQVHL